MPPPMLYSRDVEECLVAALLLFEDFAGLDECTDEEIWYDDIRHIIRAVRVLRGADKPCGAVFVLAMLSRSGQLDSLSWKGDEGEILLMDILSRRAADIQSYYSRQLGRLIHYYAEERRVLKEAQEAAKLTFTEKLEAHRKRYEGEL